MINFESLLGFFLNIANIRVLLFYNKHEKIVANKGPVVAGRVRKATGWKVGVLG